MKPENRDKLWMAYLDDEISPSEIDSFESTLGAGARTRAFSERQIEMALGERLAGQDGCPDEVWRRVRQQLADASDAPRRRAHRRWYGPLAAAAAAMLLLCFAAIRYGHDPGADLASLPAASFAAMQALSQTAPTAEAVEALLAEGGIGLDIILPDPGQSLHTTELAGARQQTIDGDVVTEIFFTCCGQSTKLLIASKNTEYGKRLFREAEKGHVASLRTLDGFIAGAVGAPMHASNVLDVLHVRA